MKQKWKLSQKMLNAFVDDQLMPGDKEKIYARLQWDKELSRQICELHKARELVRVAYKSATKQRRTMRRLRTQRA